MKIISAPKELYADVQAWRRDGHKVAVVPTMGALHSGHLSLVKLAQARADKVIATVFVNPKQFERAKDLDTYPNTKDADRKALSELGVDLLFAPSNADVYPDGFSTTVHVAGISDDLCGSHRPGHFDGVATVVTKLLTMTGADIAIFGEKDWQQLQVIKRLVLDLNLPVEIISGATVREDDGLAKSSRNLRLSKEQRAIAPRLSEIMFETAAEIRAGGDIEALSDAALKKLLEAGFAEVDYFDLRRADSLVKVSKLGDAPLRLLAAAWLGSVRLIDNIEV